MFTVKFNDFYLKLQDKVINLPIQFLIFYIILLILFLYFINLNRANTGITGIYSGITFGFMIYYAIVPILLFLFEGKFRLNGNYANLNYFVFNKEYGDYIITLIMILFGFLSFHFGYRFSLKYRISIKKHKSNEENTKRIIDKKKFLKIFEVVGISTLIVGGVSFLIIIHSLGGIANTLAIGEQFRGFDAENSLASFIGANKALLFIPSRLITVTPIIYYFLIINRKQPIDKVVFVISFILAIIFLLFNAGRSPLILFLLPFIYILLKNIFKKVWSLLIILGVMSLPLLDILDSFFIYLSTNNWSEVKVDYLSYIYQFVFPFRNIVNIQEIINASSFQYGTNIIKEVLDVLPRINFDPLYYITSEYFGGANWRSGIPTDILTYGYFQMGIIGIILTLLVVGFIAGILEKKLINLPIGKSRDFISAVMATSVMGIVTYTDLSSLLKSNVILLSICFVLIFSSRYIPTKYIK